MCVSLSSLLCHTIRIHGIILILAQHQWHLQPQLLVYLPGMKIILSDYLTVNMFLMAYFRIIYNGASVLSSTLMEPSAPAAAAAPAPASRLCIGHEHYYTMVRLSQSDLFFYCMGIFQKIM